MAKVSGVVGRASFHHLAIIVGLTLLTACAARPNELSRSQATLSAQLSGMSSSAAAIANGRAIFQTGNELNGAHIVASQPPLFDRCVACHRADGAGGVHLPDGAVSADLRHRSLVTDQRQPYTLSLLERAISTGIDNDGQPLSPIMPRWKLSKQDLHDVALNVLTQLK